jgi:hypothetical protein
MRLALLCFLALFFQQAHTQNFTTGNLVIYRVGTGSGALSSASTAVFLDEYTPSGTLVQSLALPTAASGGNFPLTASGSATSEGLLNRSSDGNYLVLTGYGAATGVASIAGTSSSSTPRIVGLVNYQKTINTTSAFTDYSTANNPRSAISSDGTALWFTGGAGGIRYATNGSTTSTQINTTGTNFRGLGIFNGQLYVSSSSGTIRLATVGTGLPTGTGQAVTNIPGFPTSGSPYQFQFFDLDAGVTGADVLYVADDAAGVQKYSLVSGSWVLNGTVGTSSDQYRGLTGSASGTTVTLFGVRKGNELVSITDATGYNAAPVATASLLATAPNNTAFRGIAFAPVSPVNNLSLTFTPSGTAPLLIAPAVTTTLSDPADPLATIGVSVDVKDNGTSIPAASYTLTAASNNTAAVPNANVNITKADGQATIKISAAATGYADVTLTLTKGSFTKTITINIAASAAANAPANTRFLTGTSDASAAIALDDNYMVVADDEMNKLFVYNRNSSGLPAATYDYSGLLSLTDLSGGAPREVDVEAAVRSISTTNRIYWLGSMSNSATSFNARPNRNRLFAVTATGTGSSTSFSYVGMYTGLRQDLITWGDANGYSFSTSAVAGKDPKLIDGFNVEGLTIAPDNSTAYIAFRAPLVPVANRTKAVIAPLLNFETWFNNGAPSGSPTLGAPMELDLGGRGFRDLVRLSNGTYIILAGNYDDLPLNPAVYTWSGNAGAAPVQLNAFNLSDLNPEAVMEVHTSGTLAADRLQVISDNGSTVYYNDGVEAKDLSQNNYKKFRSDLLISGTGSVLPLQLVNFTVERNNNSSLLNWEVGTPLFSSFTIERSADGRTFTPIGEVAATPSRSRYNYTDLFTATGKIYYRIGETDVTGRKTYSAIRVVNSGSAGLVSIYPNPVTNGRFTLSTNVEGLKYAAIFDANGRKVSDVSFTSPVTDLSTSGLPAGQYYLVLMSKEKIIAASPLSIK